jgi:hypothetical protein
VDRLLRPQVRDHERLADEVGGEHERGDGGKHGDPP